MLTPDPVPVLEPQLDAIRQAIDEPAAGPSLRRLAKAGNTVAIVVSDITRLVPNATILPPVLDALHGSGVRIEDITIIIGTGLHRPSNPKERRQILGDNIARGYRVIDHQARERSTLKYLLTTARGV